MHLPLVHHLAHRKERSRLSTFRGELQTVSAPRPVGEMHQLCVDSPAPKVEPYDKDSIAHYGGDARAGFELIEDRGADYSRLTAFALIMDVGWNGGSLVGERNKTGATSTSATSRARSPSTARSCAQAIPAT